MFKAEKCTKRSNSHAMALGHTHPWERVHVDFGEKNGKMFLVVADSHSKWLEVLLMKSTAAESTITEL